MRRNFLRFGKRSGSPVLHGEEEEREEEERRIQEERRIEEERRIQEFLSQVGLSRYNPDGVAPSVADPP